MSKPEKAPIMWLNLTVLSLTLIAAVTLVPWYGFTHGFDGYAWFWFGFFMLATGMSITSGYHRMWSHRAYWAAAPVRAFFAFFGAASLQNSILHWCADHRNHHKYVDSNDRDPYSAGRGFWFSHIGWILRSYPAGQHNFDACKDLERDPIVAWQHRYYLPLAVVSNAALPLALGWIHGELWATFLLAGVLRIVLNHHFTFFINSLAHIWGSQPYNRHDSSRDNGLLAVFTYGEGYHNFHHKFQYDYRNGIKWYHFDPSKWLVRVLAWAGLASNLRQAQKVTIDKARMQTELERVKLRLASNPARAHLAERLDEAYHRAVGALEAWSDYRKEWVEKKRHALQEKRDVVQEDLLALKDRYLELKNTWRMERRRWQLMYRTLSTSAI